MTPLFQQYQTLFENFLELSQKHRSSHHDYRWLHLKSKHFQLLPDYLTLSEFAPTKFKTMANKTLANSPKLWESLVWPKITHTILEKMESKYLHALFESTRNTHQHTPKELIKLLHRVFIQFDSRLIHAPFTDLYFFLNEILKTTSTYFEVSQDIFKKEKTEQLNFCLRLYKTVAKEILDHPQAFEIATYLAIRANWIDSVENNISHFVTGFPSEIDHLIDHPEELHLQKHNSHYQFQEFKTALATPKKILYELDNAGEVVFDLILIERLLSQKHHIHLCAKDSPVLNDITTQELQHLLDHPLLVHLKKHPNLTLLPGHSNIAGKYLPHVPESYKTAYQWADLLILKGQGNFQTMPLGQFQKNKFQFHPYTKPMFFLFMLKAPQIAQSFKKTLPPKTQSPELFSPILREFRPNRIN